MQLPEVIQEFELSLVLSDVFRCSYRLMKFRRDDKNRLTVLESASDSSTERENHVEDSNVVFRLLFSQGEASVNTHNLRSDFNLITIYLG